MLWSLSSQQAKPTRVVESAAVAPHDLYMGSHVMQRCLLSTTTVHNSAYGVLKRENDELRAALAQLNARPADNGA